MFESFNLPTSSTLSGFSQIILTYSIAILSLVQTTQAQTDTIIPSKTKDPSGIMHSNTYGPSESTSNGKTIEQQHFVQRYQQRLEHYTQGLGYTVEQTDTEGRWNVLFHKEKWKRVLLFRTELGVEQTEVIYEDTTSIINPTVHILDNHHNTDFIGEAPIQGTYFPSPQDTFSIQYQHHKYPGLGKTIVHGIIKIHEIER